MADLGAIVVGVLAAPPSGGLSLGVTAYGFISLGLDNAGNSELCDGKPEVEFYVDGKLYYTTYYGRPTFYDLNSGKRVYPIQIWT